jgi:hypothetical protein
MLLLPSAIKIQRNYSTRMQLQSIDYTTQITATTSTQETTTQTTTTASMTANNVMTSSSCKVTVMIEIHVASYHCMFCLLSRVLIMFLIFV